jgi:uncharacterized protein YdaU (DUF1376 family)
MLEHGAYTLLIDACYDRERFPKRDEAIEWCWARTPDEIAAVEFVLDRFFTLKDGTYTQERIAEELAKYHENAARNSKIATEREAKRTKRAQSVHKTSPVVHGAPPNQEPLTINQEPKDIVVSPAAPPQGTRLDKGWTLPDDWKAWCTEHRPDLDPQSVADQFRDFWVAKPGKDGRKADWLATWRNWCRSQKPGAGKPRQNLTDEGYRDLMRGSI